MLVMTLVISKRQLTHVILRQRWNPGVEQHRSNNHASTHGECCDGHHVEKLLHGKKKPLLLCEHQKGRRCNTYLRLIRSST